MSADDTQQHEASMQALRKLLFEQESARIDRLEELLNNQELHAQEIAKILAEAVQIRSRADSKLGQALTPAVEEALKISIARNPQPISDALFPVMGPAIRKAINSSIAAMMQSLNQTLEHSFTLQGLRWRWDAIRTGKPFAEIVLLNTLVYRVEQIFLIHKETGLLLKHIALDPTLNEDADVVSSMLTAVRDFIHDSFAGSDGQSIENMRMGDLQIMVEQGPDTVLALVCRGNPPQSLHHDMVTSIETIQHDFHEELQHFDGDNQSFEATDFILSPLLLADYQGKQKQGSSFKPLIVLGLIFLTFVAWFIWDYQQNATISAKWESYAQQLNNEPGIIITQHKVEDNLHILLGLRDPLSNSPTHILDSLNLPAQQLELHLQPYQSLEAPFVLKRAVSLLQPPQSILLSLNAQTLVLSGSASAAWLDYAQKTAPFIAGIEQIDISQLTPEKTLLERISTLLKPSKDIHLSLQGKQLMVSGKATQTWAKKARKNMLNIPEIKQYKDNKLVLVDTPQYVLKQAYSVLQPPKTIQLYITPARKLIAKGSASDVWIKQAKQRGKTIAYVTAYDDKQVTLSSNHILQRAITMLQPPESVQLSLSNKVLLATGQANQDWIQNAKQIAPTIEGIDRFDNQTSILWDEAAVLASAIKHLQPPASVTLSFKQGVLHASGAATGAWISRAQEQFMLIDGVHSFYTNNLENTTKAWTDIQREIRNVTITFPPSIANITPEIDVQIANVAALFQQARLLEPQSHLLIKALHQKTETFITALRLKAIKDVLLKKPIPKDAMKTDTQTTDADIISQSISFSLIGDNDSQRNTP